VPDDTSVSTSAVTSAPTTLDRSALERVLARASELSSQANDDAPDGMTESQLLEIGKEVGLAPSVLQQALAEERTRVVLVEETGMEARVMGPASVSTTRAIPHTPEQVLAALEEWMRSDYRMNAKRRFGNRRTWEQRSGVFAELERGLRGNEAAAALVRATEIAATVSPIGDGRTAVRMDADITDLRRARRSAGIATAVVGLVASAVPVVLGAALAPLAMLPLFVAAGVVPLLGCGLGGWAILKSHRKSATRAQLALEQLLDRLEHGALPRTALPGGSGAPLIAETLTAVAKGVMGVAQAVQDAAAAKRGQR
jgi:hypothetical protein